MNDTEMSDVPMAAQQLNTASESNAVTEAPSPKPPASLDVTTMSKETRRSLLEGPTISVFVGGALIRKKVPILALGATSSHFKEALQGANNLPEQIDLPNFDFRSVKIVLNALTTEAGIGGDDCVPIDAGANFVADYRIYQVCLGFGAEKESKNALDRMRDTITARMLSHEEIGIVLEGVTTENCEQDALFMHLAHNLCHRRFKKQIPNIGTFEKYLTKRPVLKEATLQIDHMHKAKRDRFRQEKQAEAMAMKMEE
ncbi:hypothetical protein BDV95DRAFT_654614 [Massariosphaeria phaeospora]|uniref:BTB domain-containing protein n=1 Tax=Massariosphaeria phaeospora TaxID=100035 RepID=A0A7C8IBY4_9PLEO|nr:hypothetical protein BDV95DRAFT_654614 [Massariosphaeria phaeospora]